MNKQNHFITVADKHRIITKAARPSNFIARNELILLSVCNKSLKDFYGVETREWNQIKAALFHSSRGSLAFSGLGCCLADNDVTIGASPWNSHMFVTCF